MYEEYFGLSGAPFKLSPDPRFFFGSRSHNKAMAYLHYGLKQAEGFIVITGPIGAGKSMVIGHLMDQLDSSDVAAAHLLTSNVKSDELLGHILSAFRIESEGEGRAGQLAAFEDFLFDQLNRGRRVLLVLDEAQNLPRETLEELRMLSNMDYEGTPLFQVFLVGQPEFRGTMESPTMEQLRQRVIASYHLENLSEEETKEYILHRLSVAGWQEDPCFTDGALAAVYDETRGLPRRINTLCNRLMLYCYLEKHHEVTSEIVDLVVAELRDEKLAQNNEQSAAQGLEDIKNELAAQMGDAVADDQQSLDAQNASSSVYDRIRPAGSPEEEGQSDDLEGPPQEATLTDVASAIAAVGETEHGEAVDPILRTEAPSTGATISSIAQMARDLRRARGTAQWRKTVVGSITDTRDELHQAHASVLRLRKKLSTLDKRRVRNRAEIVDSLSRAETLLREIRDSWR